MTTLVLIAPARALEALTELCAAYRHAGVAVRPMVNEGELPDEAALRRLAAGTDALLLVGNPRRAPRTVLPGPVLRRPDGVPIPVGWLPERYPGLYRFGRAAARVHQRGNGQAAAAVLSQWHSQYLRLAQRIEALLQQAGTPVFRWSSDLLLRENMVRGLGSGLGAAIYVGHGRPVGWVGYRGMRLHHFEEARGEPVGLLLSLCCHTASRRGVGLSFAEALPLLGVAGASFGAVRATRHTNNTRWAVGLCRALADGAETAGELVVAACPRDPAAVRDYRLLGDPLAPLAAAPGVVRRASAIAVWP